MKKLLATICVALVSLGASAQTGDKFAGANLSYGTEIKSLGIGVKGQYFFTDNIRGEASFDYFLKKDGLSMWDVNANVHYLFGVADKIKVYPLAGLGLTNWVSSGIEIDYDYDDDDDYDFSRSTRAGFDDDDDSGSSTESKNTFNLGCGAQYELTDKINLTAELKYQIVSNFNQLVFGVGVAYKF